MSVLLRTPANIRRRQCGRTRFRRKFLRYRNRHRSGRCPFCPARKDGLKSYAVLGIRTVLPHVNDSVRRPVLVSRPPAMSHDRAHDPPLSVIDRPDHRFMVARAPHGCIRIRRRQHREIFSWTAHPVIEFILPVQPFHRKSLHNGMVGLTDFYDEFVLFTVTRPRTMVRRKFDDFSGFINYVELVPGACLFIDPGVTRSRWVWCTSCYLMVRSMWRGTASCVGRIHAWLTHPGTEHSGSGRRVLRKRQEPLTEFFESGAVSFRGRLAACSPQSQSDT